MTYSTPAPDGATGDSGPVPAPETMLDLALQYAARGMPVFPCDPRPDPAKPDRPSKRPLTASGFKAATTDPDRVRAWWTQWPGALVAMPTGEASGVAVLDLDLDTDPDSGEVVKDGEGALRAAMEANGWALPANVPAARTARGGLHLWFRHRPGYRSRTNVLPGVDTRAEGGYVIAPGSRGAVGGSWSWLANPDAEPPEAPGWLAALFTEGRLPGDGGEPEAAAGAGAGVPAAGADALRPAPGGGPDLTEADDVRRALAGFWDPDDFGDWTRAALALHRHPEGRSLWMAWAATSPKFDASENATKWNSTAPSSGITARSILHRVPAATLSQWARVRAASAGRLNVAKGAADAGGAGRREAQREANRMIGSTAPEAALPSILELGDMLQRFVFATDGSRVIDLESPRRCYALADFRNAFAASTTSITVKRAGEDAARDVPTADLWRRDPARRTVHGVTFRPGAGVFTEDPEGHPCVNSWRPPERGEPSARFEENAAMFCDHVRYLFADDADRFLDWLAHIEQRPGELPSTAWLHVSTATGTGRNYVASVLSRCWRGMVAPGFNLARSLDSGFNGELAGKVLAIVDEIREGGRADQWAHSESLKQMITTETRLVNPKYGRTSLEYNVCRMLLFSNFDHAIPLEQNDRRFEVVTFDGSPRPPQYYSELYGRVDDPAFVSDVALFLARRDLASFNRGRHAATNAAKERVIDACRSEASLYAKAVAEHWPADVITNAVLADILDPGSGGTLSRAGANAASEHGIRPRRVPTVSVLGTPQRVRAIRNHDRWNAATPAEVAEEVLRGTRLAPGGPPYDWRGFIDRLAARSP